MRLHLLLFPLVFLACGGGDSNYRPKAIGPEGDLMLVVTDEYWREHPLGDTLRTFFQQEYPGLPQVEPLWKISRISPSDFQGNLRWQKNVLIAVVSEKIPAGQPSLEFAEDAFARPQLVIRLSANHPNEWLAAFRARRAEILARLKEKDARVIAQSIQEKNSCRSCADTLKNRMGVQLPIPSVFSSVLNNAEISAFQYRAERVEKGNTHLIEKVIWVSSVKYNSETQFSIQYLTWLSDQITQKAFKGENPGSGVVVESRMPCDSTILTLNGRYAMEMRGLWRMSNEFKGGPFLLYATLDEANQRIWLSGAFVFAAGLDKRSHIIELEGILRSLNLIAKSGS
ncbi:MAG: DUF4837 family protein [Bacteroidia bacterium]|jgi:hypothetical protein